MGFASPFLTSQFVVFCIYVCVVVVSTSHGQFRSDYAPTAELKIMSTGKSWARPSTKVALSSVIQWLLFLVVLLNMGSGAPSVSTTANERSQLMPSHVSPKNWSKGEALVGWLARHSKNSWDSESKAILDIQSIRTGLPAGAKHSLMSCILWAWT